MDHARLEQTDERDAEGVPICGCVNCGKCGYLRALLLDPCTSLDKTSQGQALIDAIEQDKESKT